MTIEHVARRRGSYKRPEKTALTDRQLRIVEAIRAYVEENGYAPTLREIGAAVNLVSPSSVAYQLRQIAEFGALTFDPDRPRALSLTASAPLPADICSSCRGTGLAS